ncbi:hypothetical protein EV126DRAFT_166597 [Verticillium dahliae]|nr:hypothetical protein EV126DRAFT_166597 [Verticillium dahliae]
MKSKFTGSGFQSPADFPILAAPSVTNDQPNGSVPGLCQPRLDSAPDRPSWVSPLGVASVVAFVDPTKIYHTRGNVERSSRASAESFHRRQTSHPPCRDISRQICVALQPATCASGIHLQKDLAGWRRTKPPPTKQRSRAISLCFCRVLILQTTLRSHLICWAIDVTLAPICGGPASLPPQDTARRWGKSSSITQDAPTRWRGKGSRWLAFGEDKEGEDMENTGYRRGAGRREAVVAAYLRPRGPLR